jgi:hypothetical protein
VAEAIARSLNDLVPADNALPIDAALDWSRLDWERQEAKQQRRLLDLAAVWRRAIRATPTAAPTAPVAPMPLIKLKESSDNNLYRPTPPRGDPGQGSSHWYEARPLEDAGNSSDEDDGGDYTAFYRYFGM